jgi:hypothetical protein
MENSTPSQKSAQTIIRTKLKTSNQKIKTQIIRTSRSSRRKNASLNTFNAEIKL